MSKIEPGKFVELVYDLYEVNPDLSEQLVHTTSPDDPEKLIYGVTPGVIPALEQALQGLEEGGEFNVTVPGAFGMFDPEQIAELPRDVFEIDGKFDSERVKPGAVLPMMTADGYRINGVVTEVSDKTIKMDFNHPLAGKTVRFQGHVKLVRDATPEELQPVHGCGGGCGSCGGCGSDEGCRCSDEGACCK